MSKIMTQAEIEGNTFTAKNRLITGETDNADAIARLQERPRREGEPFQLMEGDIIKGYPNEEMFKSAIASVAINGTPYSYVGIKVIRGNRELDGGLFPGFFEKHFREVEGSLVVKDGTDPREYHETGNIVESTGEPIDTYRNAGGGVDTLSSMFTAMKKAIKVKTKTPKLRWEYGSSQTKAREDYVCELVYV